METQEITQEITPELLDFINSNPVFYQLSFAGYENGKMIYSKPNRFAIRDAARDLELFKQRQEAINQRTKISEGDWIIRKSGKYEQISVASHGHVQAGGHGGVYIYKSGNGSYSGSCGDSIKAYELTPETKEGSCWIFSGDSTGAHRGVYHKLQFKVWKEI